MTQTLTDQTSTPTGPFKLSWRQWRTLLAGAWSDANRDDLGLIAAGVAFFLTMAMFPALSAMVAFYGLIGDPVRIAEQLVILRGVAPRPVLDLAREQADRLITANASILALHGFVSALLALWGAQQGARSFLRALTVINKRTSRRGLLKRYLIGGAFTVGAMIVGMATIFLFAVAPVLFDRIGADATLALSLLRGPILIVIVAGFAMSLYRWGPNRAAPRWAWVWPGAMLASVSWLIVSAGFSVYVDVFAPMRAAYGVFSGVFILMLWLFLSAYIFLLGAEINARLENICSGGDANKRPKAILDPANKR